MKAGKEHRAPLAPRALAILDEMTSLHRICRAEYEADAFVFPGGRQGKALSNMGMAMTLRRMGREDLTVHGFRSSFRDWAAERTKFSSEVAEMALAHAVGDKVEAAYRRGDMFEKRRRLTAEWAKYCSAIPAAQSKVVPLRK